MPQRPPVNRPGIISPNNADETYEDPDEVFTTAVPAATPTPVPASTAVYEDPDDPENSRDDNNDNSRSNDNNDNNGNESPLGFYAEPLM